MPSVDGVSGACRPTSTKPTAMTVMAAKAAMRIFFMRKPIWRRRRAPRRCEHAARIGSGGERVGAARGVQQQRGGGGGAGERGGGAVERGAIEGRGVFGRIVGGVAGAAVASVTAGSARRSSVSGAPPARHTRTIFPGAASGSPPSACTHNPPRPSAASAVAVDGRYGAWNTPTARAAQPIGSTSFISVCATVRTPKSGRSPTSRSSAGR